MSDNGERGMNLLIVGERQSFHARDKSGANELHSNTESGVAGGLSSLIILSELMDRVRAAGGDPNIRKMFPVMAGSGTGA
jgi:hypothetical protein